MIANIVSIAPRKLNPANMNAPIKIPMARDMYTSFVANARMIVITGGRSDHTVSAIKTPILSVLPADSVFICPKVFRLLYNNMS